MGLTNLRERQETRIYVAGAFVFSFTQPTGWLPDRQGSDAEVVRLAMERSQRPLVIDGPAGMLEGVIRTWLEYKVRTASELALSSLCETAYGLRILAVHLRDSLDEIQESAAPQMGAVISETGAGADGLGEIPQRFFELDRVARRLERLLQQTVTSKEEGDRLYGLSGDHPLVRLLMRRHRGALADVSGIRAEGRSAADTFASSVAAQQLVMSYRERKDAAEERRRADRFARDATLIASLVLMPTLVASVFGANVPLPFAHHVAGTIIMLALMVIFALVMLVVIRRRHPG